MTRRDGGTKLERNRIGLRVGEKISLGFVESVNNKIRFIQQRAYEIWNEKYLA